MTNSLIIRYIKIILIFFILISSSYANARTREKSIQNFLDTLIVNNEGFKMSQNSNVTIFSNELAQEISLYTKYTTNKSSQILYFTQRSQNKDGGFGESPNMISNWNSTINAIKSLQFLHLNKSQLENWDIFNFLNTTMDNYAYNITISNNNTIYNLYPLNQTLLNIWYQYIEASLTINIGPSLNSVFLINEAKNLQYPNGTYPNYFTAFYSIQLLKLLSDKPKDSDLAGKYFIAHQTNNYLFANVLNSTGTLKDSYYAIYALYLLNKLNLLENKNKLIAAILNLQVANNGFKDIFNNNANLLDTWYAIQILKYLNALDELLSPDVLQTQGFINYQVSLILIPLSLFVIVKRRKSYE